MCQVSCFYHKLHDYPLKWHLSIGLLNNICGRIFSVKSVIGVFYRYIVWLHAGEPNKSVPQNICSSGQSFLAGRFWKNNLSLEGKCFFGKDNSGCPRVFDISKRCYGVFVRNPRFRPPPTPPPPQPTKGLGFALWPHPNWPVMSGHTSSAGKLPSKSGCSL